MAIPLWPSTVWHSHSGQDTVTFGYDTDLKLEACVCESQTPFLVLFEAYLISLLKLSFSPMLLSVSVEKKVRNILV